MTGGDDILETTRARYADLAPTLPPALSASLRRHAEQLSALVQSLRAAGFDEASVRENVAILVRRYEAELTAALGAMGEGRDHG